MLIFFPPSEIVCHYVTHGVYQTGQSFSYRKFDESIIWSKSDQDLMILCSTVNVFRPPGRSKVVESNAEPIYDERKKRSIMSNEQMTFDIGIDSYINF